TGTGNVGIGTTTPLALLEVSGTGTNSAIFIPRDTTANRPGGNARNGMIRYNTNSSKFEAYESGSWKDIATGTVGTGDFKADGTVAMTGNININNNKLVNLALGSADSPGLSFNSDSNTGIYSPA